MFEKSKEVPKFNYIYFLFMILAVILVVYFISRLYENRINELKEIPIIRNSLSEINSTEIDHYIVENPNSVLYICKPSDDVCRSFEKKFKTYVEKNGLNNSIIYVNLNSDINEFFDNINSKYITKKSISHDYPAIIILEEGEVKDFIQGKENKPLTVSDVKYFLKKYDIGVIDE